MKYSVIAVLVALASAGGEGAWGWSGLRTNDEHHENKWDNKVVVVSDDHHEGGWKGKGEKKWSGKKDDDHREWKKDDNHHEWKAPAWKGAERHGDDHKEWKAETKKESNHETVEFSNSVIKTDLHNLKEQSELLAKVNAKGREAIEERAEKNAERHENDHAWKGAERHGDDHKEWKKTEKKGDDHHEAWTATPEREWTIKGDGYKQWKKAETKESAHETREFSKNVINTDLHNLKEQSELLQKVNAKGIKINEERAERNAERHENDNAWKDEKHGDGHKEWKKTEKKDDDHHEWKAPAWKGAERHGDGHKEWKKTEKKDDDHHEYEWKAEKKGDDHKEWNKKETGRFSGRWQGKKDW